MCSEHEAPLSREEIEKYRKMTVADKFRLTVKLTEEHLAKLLAGPPEVADKFFEEVRRENDERNRAMLEAFARMKRVDGGG